MKIRFMCMQHYCDLNPSAEDEQLKNSSVACLVNFGDGTYEFDVYSSFDCPDAGEQFPDCATNGRWTAVIYNNFTMPGDADIRLRMADNGKNFVKE